MATANDILTYARYQCQTDTNGLSDTVGLAYANDALENFTRELIARDIDAAQVQESYTSTVSGTGTYAYPSDKYFLKTIEINTGSGAQTDYLQAEKIDVANLQGQTSFDFLRVNQNANEPLFDDRGDTFEIFPTPVAAIGAGIKIIYFLTPTEYSTTSSTLTYPVTLDYRCLASRVSSLYQKQMEKYNSAAVFEKEYQDRLQGIIRILQAESQQPISTQALQNSGWQY